MLMILRRIAQRHLVQHLLFPLIVGMLVEATIARWQHTGNGWRGFMPYLLSYERAGLILGIVMTYLLLMYYFIKKDTDIGMKRIGMAELEAALDHATEFFAIGTIRLREWFEPVTQAYFTAIATRSLTGHRHLHCTRVLFFFTNSDMKNVDNLYLDGYYAKRLTEIHERFKAKLAFLKRREIFEFLNELSIEDRRALGCYPLWINWLGEKTLEKMRKIPLSLLRRRIRKLAFALVKHDDGQLSVVLFTKHGQTLDLEVIEEPDRIKPYSTLVNSIRAQIYKDPDAPLEKLMLKVRYDFSKYFF